MKAAQMIEMVKRSGLGLDVTRVRGYQIISIVIYLGIILAFSTSNSIVSKIIASGLILYVLAETVCIDWLIKQYTPYVPAREEQVDEKLEQKDNISYNPSSKISHLNLYKEDILKLRKAGLSYQKIAEKYGVSRTTMTKFIKNS